MKSKLLCYLDVGGSMVVHLVSCLPLLGSSSRSFKYVLLMNLCLSMWVYFVCCGDWLTFLMICIPFKFVHKLDRFHCLLGGDGEAAYSRSICIKGGGLGRARSRTTTLYCVILIMMDWKLRILTINLHWLGVGKYFDVDLILFCR